MSDPLEYMMEAERDFHIAFAVCNESNRIGIGNVTLAVTLERVATLPDKYVTGYQETVNDLDLRVEENHLSIRLNYSRFMEGLTLPTESAESWNEFRSKLYESLKVAGVKLQNYLWLKVREITFYSRIVLEKNFEVYSQVIGSMSLFGKGVELQNGSFVFDSKLFSLRISRVVKNFNFEFNVRDSGFYFEPESALLLEFSLHDQEAFAEIFNRSICLQELESQNVVKFYTNVLKNLSESIEHLILQDRLFKFFDVILSYNNENDKPAFKEELNKVNQLLLAGDRKMNEDWTRKTAQSQIYGSILKIIEDTFESESLLKQLRRSLKEKSYLVKELCEKLKGDIFIDHI
ncbi:hypothetical protein [Leptospira santarosai]|uniref:hypothetical protein n=1 Tax=Leptospira santarosai TaxID=28183 RepID=UPI0024AF7400|nr:hypothetical protein [Leptospira santarosai]MDI7174965.1 hypothetical protein [Leptospira santarosai]MDI7194533.1 hypothetical protein [Leptospira santarosai]MDO6399016.1 hypothetical protein [Leptospira santarosai]MDO6404375.1 hypothetical protein [Leptospira santarosai]